MGDGPSIHLNDLLLDDLAGSSGVNEDDGPELLTLAKIRSTAEIRAIKRALREAEGNISRAAKALDVSRPTLYALIERLNIETTTEL